jgi:hypothetical protein
MTIVLWRISRIPYLYKEQGTGDWGRGVLQFCSFAVLRFKLAY